MRFRAHALTLSGTLAVLLLGAVSPAPAHRVKDTNTAPLPVNLDHRVFSITRGSDVILSIEGRLWRTDGTSEGTRPLGEMVEVSVRSLLISFQGNVYFTGSNSASGTELWKTDGTEGGTELLRDIAPGAASSAIYSYAPFQGRLYFAAGVTGHELWKTDGTSAGTVKAFDASVRPNGTGFGGMAAVGNRLLFVGPSSRDASRPNAIYATDGTLEGTQPIAEFALGSSGGPCAGSCAGWPPSDFVVMGDVLYFIASDGISGLELWRTDGTPNGTRIVKDICPGTCNAFPFSDGLAVADGLLLHVVNGRLLFFADDGALGSELWTSDGTEAGTKLVKDIYPGSKSSSWGIGMASAETAAFFSADDGIHGQQLFRSDGTATGTVLVPSLPVPFPFSPGLITITPRSVFFVLADQPGHTQLWRTDLAGSPAFLVSDAFSNPTGLAAVGDLVVFAATESNGASLWKSDGTSSGTSRVRVLIDENTSSFPFPMGELDGKLIFSATNDSNSRRLFTSDGTEEGTRQLTNISGGESVRFRNWLFFGSDDGIHGLELWRTDGTESGTHMVRDIGQPGPNFVTNRDANPCAFNVLGDKLLFGAFDGQHPYGLWATDGSESGTTYVRNVVLNCYWGNTVSAVTFRDYLYFAGLSPSFEPGLWRTDGTTEGTEPVAPVSVNNLALFRDRLLFYGSNAAGVSGLWVSDGTGLGTILVKPLSFPFQHSQTQAGVFFITNDSGGPGLWISDGTPDGTKLLVNIGQSTVTSEILAVGERVFFEGHDAEHGTELWTSDGTETGTHILKDISPGPSPSNPRNLTAIGGVLLFSARDRTHGEELWRSDGTVAGTYLLQDISPGSASSSPANFMVAGSLVYFTADDGKTGVELWAIPLSAVNPSLVRLPPAVRLPQKKNPAIPWRQ